MKSFKKIALAVVAAMTMGTLVATPASAAPMTVAVTTWNAAKAGGADYDTPATAGTATTSAITRPVPTDNSVDNVDVVKFVATVDLGTSVSVSATNALIVDAVATSTSPKTAASGAATWSQNVGTGTTATFYVYTKTTAIGSVSITNGGTTTTYFVQGTTDKINNLVLSGVDAAAAGTSVTVTISAVDVFGNKISGKSISAIANGATLDSTTVTTGSGLTNFGSADVKFVAPATGPVTIVVYAASADMATAVTGFSTPSASAVKIVQVRDITAELATIAAQLAAEKAAHEATKLASAAKDAEIAKLKADAAAATAASTKAIADLKKAFNALAVKWNKKNPKAKVTLVK
ncbi:MAG: hypothetical protein RLZZ196_337 [Bacteroidota bacterium]|jgi:hypothetical protein